MPAFESLEPGRNPVRGRSHDASLERAFADAGEEFDLVSSIALGRHRGKFLHVSADGEATVVEVPNAYSGLSPEERTVILRVHGQVDRKPERDWESNGLAGRYACRGARASHD